METNNLVKDLKEMIRCYEKTYHSESPVNLEIKMWRERFLCEYVSVLDDTKERFLSTPSSTFSINRPESILDKCIYGDE